MSLRICYGLVVWLFACCVHAAPQAAFDAWWMQFEQEAVAQGIAAKTAAKARKQANLLEEVIALDQSQPEFVSSFSRYVSRRVNDANISLGKSMLLDYDALLMDVEASYLVPKNVLLAFWGLETNYGQFLGSHDLVSALSTLAYDGRREAFFKQQLIALLQIAEDNQLKLSSMQGSWAGAFGHMQFMPTTFKRYAVDGNLDGKINLWQSLPDAFNSAANYLSSIGWVYQQPIAIEVHLPEKFDYQLAHLKERHPVDFWQALGVSVPEEVAGLQNTAIILPQGWQGPAFMVFSNFDVVMRWNRSVNYALSVALLSEAIAGQSVYMASNESDAPRISLKQVAIMQTKLNDLGFNAGKPDGLPGSMTQAAVRQYQVQHGLPADGYPSLDFYHRLLKTAQ